MSKVSDLEDLVVSKLEPLEEVSAGKKVMLSGELITDLVKFSKIKMKLKS